MVRSGEYDAAHHYSALSARPDSLAVSTFFFVLFSALEVHFDELELDYIPEVGCCSRAQMFL